MPHVKQPVRSYLVEGTVDGEQFAILQIEIDCVACGMVRLLIPGHHLKTVRDVIVDHLDQFPALAEGKTTKISSTGVIPIGGTLSQKPESN